MSKRRVKIDVEIDIEIDESIDLINVCFDDPKILYRKSKLFNVWHDLPSKHGRVVSIKKKD